VKDNVNIKEVFEYLTAENYRRGNTAGGGAVASIADYSAQPAHQDTPAKDAAPGREESHTPSHTPQGGGAAASTSPDSAKQSSPASLSREDSGGDADNTPGRGIRNAPQYDRPKPQQNVVKLVPSKVRTGNKKRSFCSIL